MSRTASYVEFSCPNMDCGWSCSIRWIPDTRIDPGYLDADPPEECPECGHPMEDDGEPGGPPEPDPDAAYDFDR